jgi:hypothetical protein
MIRRKTIKWMLNNKQVNDFLNKQELQYFNKFINEHHNGHNNTNILSVQRITNKSIPKLRCFLCEFIRENQTELIKEVIGYSDTAEIKPTNEQRHLQHIFQALRCELQKDHQAIREAMIKQCNRCNICNKLVDMFSSHLDHHGKYEFDEIVNLWLSNKEISSIKITYRDDMHIGFILLENEALSANWKEFHNSKAQLQVTCPKCNIDKNKIKKCTTIINSNPVVLPDSTHNNNTYGVPRPLERKE